MERITLGRSGLQSSRLAYGCMRIVGDGGTEARNRGKRAVQTAVDSGYTLFDHADIYADGACEALFGELLSESPGLRDDIAILSKCGIVPSATKRYDFSRAHILASVDGSLRRLGVERLDVLLLHRPDFLMDVHEVAAAFEALSARGKVAEFGVSNFPPARLTALQSVLPMPLRIQQIEINIHRVAPFYDGTLDQCRAEGVTPQAWAPLAGIAREAWGNTFTHEQSERIAAEAGRQAQRYGVEPWQIALAWLLAHPAGISPIVGSTTPERIAAATRAPEIDYTREDWYRLLEARNGHPVA